MPSALPVVLQNDSRCFCSFDAYSAVWCGVTLHQVLDFYQVYDSFRDCFDVSKLTPSTYVTTSLFYSLNGFAFSISAVEYQQLEAMFPGLSVELFFEYQFKNIRVQIMGQGLQYMRDNGVAVDALVRLDPQQYGIPCHVTRIDVAFDFVNYGHEIFDRSYAWLHNSKHLSLTGRLCVKGMTSGLVFKQINDPSEKIIYLGSKDSDRLLRIYDKKLEITQKNHGIFDTLKYGDPSSVRSIVRVEWQLRHDCAEKILFGSDQIDYWTRVLRALIDSYQIYDPSSTTKVIAPWFRTFFDFQIFQVLDKLRFIQEIDLPADKLQNWFVSQARRNNLLYLLLHGTDEYIAVLRDYYDNLFVRVPSDPVERSMQLASRQAFILRAKAIAGDTPLCEAFPHWINPDGSFNDFSKSVMF